MLSSLLAPSVSHHLLRDLGNYYTALSGVARKQRIKDPSLLRTTAFRKHFWLTADEVARWNEIFGVTRSEPLLPYTYHAPLAATGLNRLIRDAGLNLNNVLHIRNAIEYSPKRDAELRIGRRYMFEGAFDGLDMVSERHAVLRASWNVTSADKQLVCSGKDHFVVRNVQDRDRTMLRHRGGTIGTHDVNLREFASPTSPLQGRPHSSHPLHFPEDMGIRYGRVSGQVNIVNVNRPLTKLLGYPRPLAQGQCIANQVIGALCTNRATRLRSLDLRYCRPVFLGQSVTLRLGNDALEIVDDTGAILVWGKWS